MSDYDSRRTGNGLLDTGSTPVWSTLIIKWEWRSRGKDMVEVMTDRQYDGILQMIEMIVDGCKDLEEAKRKIAELRREKKEKTE